jgi:uncharacterized membrane protein (UPF0127 family)
MTLKKKTRLTLASIGIAALLILASVVWGMLSQPKSETNPAASSGQNGRLIIGTAPELAVRIANTPTTRAQGLSGTQPLKENEGMFFIFENDDLWGFWMRDMLYPIDIIWLSAQLEVVHIVHAVPPESYPATFEPEEKARYVLEVPAGFAARHGIGIGTPARVWLPDGNLLP